MNNTKPVSRLTSSPVISTTRDRRTRTPHWKRALAVLLSLSLVLASVPAQAGKITRYVHTDHLGSVSAKTDSTGVVMMRRSFTPYGENEQAETDGPGYTGHYSDTGSGLVYMQQRYYDPEIGRFLSVDPVTFSQDKPQQFNRYWYAAGNPYKYTDPDGREVAGIMLDNDVEELVSGEITKEEYMSRLQARGKGAAIGVSVLGSAASVTSAAIAVTRVMVGTGSIETMTAAAEVAGMSELLSESLESMTEYSDTGQIDVGPTEAVAVTTAALPGGNAVLELIGAAASLGAQAVEHYQEQSTANQLNERCIEYENAK